MNALEYDGGKVGGPEVLRQDLLQAERGDSQCGGDDCQSGVSLQHGSGALIELGIASVAWFGFGKSAVGDVDDGPVISEWWTVSPGVDAASDIHLQSGTDSGRDGQSDSFGIGEHSEAWSICELQPAVGDPCAIARTSSADVIPHFQQSDGFRWILLPSVLCQRDSGFHADKFAEEFGAVFPPEAGHFAGCVQCESVILLCDSNHGGSHFLHVGVGEAVEAGDTEHAGLRLEPVGFLPEQLPLRFCGGLSFNIDAHGQMQQLHGWSDAGFQGMQQAASGFQSAGQLIEVWIGAITEECVAVFGHLCRDIGMQVQCADDGQIRTNVLPDQLQPVAIGVGCIFGDGGTMRCDEQSIEWSGLLQAADEQLHQLCPAVVCDGAVGHGAGGEDADWLRMAVFFKGLEEATDFMWRAAKRLQDVFAGHQQIGLEVCERCGLVQERIAFVQQSDDADAFHVGGPGRSGQGVIRYANRTLSAREEPPRNPHFATAQTPKLLRCREHILSGSGHNLPSQTAPAEAGGLQFPAGRPGCRECYSAAVPLIISSSSSWMMMRGVTISMMLSVSRPTPLFLKRRLM